MAATFSEFLENLADVKVTIEKACQSAGRSEENVQLLPVTKTHPAEIIGWVAQAGLVSVGENRVQEAERKRAAAADQPVQWELIGHLQSNKAKLAVSLFDRIQSVDSEKLLRALDKAAQVLGKPIRVLLQVNAGDDPAKYGVDPGDAPALLEAALGCTSLEVEGLMTIAPLDRDREVARRCFARLREVRDALVQQFGHPLPELSMGMSGDLAEAIAEGSTLVRVGTALFGARTP